MRSRGSEQGRGNAGFGKVKGQASRVKGQGSRVKDLMAFWAVLL